MTRRQILAAFTTPILMNADDRRRHERLRTFFHHYRSRLVDYTDHFILSADLFELDWRLLPSLAITETGGKNPGNNNVFGWGNGTIRFHSIEESIVAVAKSLAHDLPYKGKSLFDKLRAYNPANRVYPEAVLRVMRQVCESV